MRRCRRLRVPSILLISGLITAACAGGTTPDPAHAVPTPASNATQAALLPTTVNALPFMDVATFRELLDQLKGTPVVVNVWGSWCIPCKSEAPMLSAAARAHPDVQFLGVDIFDSRNGALGFLTNYEMPYPSVFDPLAAIKIDLGASGQPDTFFFDTNGTLATEVLGILSQTNLDAGLAKIAPA